MYILDKRNLLRYIWLGAVFVLALPFNLGKLTGLSNWFSPFLVLSSVIVLKSIVILHLIGLIILVFSWFRSRWFCKYLCPVGFSFDIITMCFPSNKVRSFSKIPPINKWLVAISFGGALFGFSLFLFLDPLVIFNGFFGSLIHSFDLLVLLTLAAFPLLLVLQKIAPGLWCEKICPSGGLQLSIAELKKFVTGSSSNAKKSEAGRRLFIGGTIGALAAIALPDFKKKNTEPAIRPPGSIESYRFDTLCIRCGSCIKVCPTQILKHETRLTIGLLTPIISFEDGYCLENCNLCSSVCPSGAITHYNIKTKKTIKIAQTLVDMSNCYLIKQKECAICKNACHYNAISFNGIEEASIKMKVVIDQQHCNGCGACFIICPENCFKMKAV